MIRAVRIKRVSVNPKIWSVDVTEGSFEKLILAAAGDGDQTVELSDGRRFVLTARAAEPKMSAKVFLNKGGPLADDEGFGD